MGMREGCGAPQRIPRQTLNFTAVRMQGGINMNGLKLTDHASVRMAQRNVSLPDAELITLIGTEVSDGYLVRLRTVNRSRCS